MTDSRSPERGELLPFSPEAPARDAEFVLSHAGNVQATGFVEHLKLRRCVDFQAELVLLCQLAFLDEQPRHPEADRHPPATRFPSPSAKRRCPVAGVTGGVGEVLAVVGESGSGKSTLLSMLSVQLAPTRLLIAYRTRRSSSKRHDCRAIIRPLTG